MEGIGGPVGEGCTRGGEIQSNVGGFAPFGCDVRERHQQPHEPEELLEGRPDASEVDQVDDKPAIFKGLTFWMAGRTSIPERELKQLLVAYGGCCEPYGQ